MSDWRENLKKGDRVVVDLSKEYANFEIKTGQLTRMFGTVIGDNDTIARYVPIEFDNHMDGHSCISKGRFGYCWNVHYNSIIEIAPKTQQPTELKGDNIDMKEMNYVFRGIPNRKLLCKDAFEDGVYSFILIDEEDTCIVISDIVEDIPESMEDYLFDEYYGYKEYLFPKRYTSQLIGLCKIINKSEMEDTKEIRNNLRDIAKHSNSFHNKVIYFK